MKKKNIILMVVFLILTLVFPVRSFLFPVDYGQNAIDRGEVVFNKETRNEAFKYTQYIMLFLFGSLTLVYGYKAFVSNTAERERSRVRKNNHQENEKN